MKHLLTIAVAGLLYSCSASKELQVEMRSGKITNVETLTRYSGDMKRIEWTLDDRTKRYEYLSADHNVRLGDAGVFLVQK